MMRTLHCLAAILCLTLGSCLPEKAADQGQPSPTEQLAALGKLAASRNPQLRVLGESYPLGTATTTSPADTVTFEASYTPQRQTLVYQLNRGGMIERFVVDPESAVFSRDGQPDQQVNRDSVMPNGKDWPYASRMVAPFLDAADGYAATLISFKVKNADPPAMVKDADGLTWFQLELNQESAHDLLLLEFSKVAELKIGIDPASGLLKSVVAKHKDANLPTTEIRSR